MAESTDGLQIVACEDVDMLTALFKQLAEDEQTDTPRTDAQYREAMDTFLRKGEKAFIAVADGQTIGYALVMMDCAPLYLHHFYICRNARRKGAGTAFFHLLIQTLKAKEMSLDVFDWNERGKAFWRSLGFVPRNIQMRYHI